MMKMVRFCLSPVMLASGLSAAAGPVDIGTRRELFVDGALVAELRGAARRQLHRPVRRDVVIVHDAPWEGNSTLYHTVFQDGDRYRMYYRGWGFDISAGKLDIVHRPVVCYAESSDGLHFTKPNLGLVAFDESTENNIIWDGVGSHNFSPFRDPNPDCDPAARYKALGGIKPEGGLFAFGSPDGIHWTLLSDKPVITEGAFDSQNIAFWDAAQGTYRSYQRIFREGRDISTSTSPDFLTWTDPEPLAYEPGRLTQFYTNQIIPYHRAPHILLGFPTRYIAGRALLTPLNETISAITPRFGTDYTDGGFMVSRDRQLFEVWDEAFIRPGPTSPDRWVYGANYQNWGIVETEPELPGAPAELSVYASEAYWEGPGARMRRYTLRLDGFVSVQAPLRGGELVTEPIVFALPDKPPLTPAERLVREGPITRVSENAMQGSGNLCFERPAVITMPETHVLGTEVTLACAVRQVSAGHRRLFSAYNGGPTTPNELYFDLGSPLGAIRFSYDGLTVAGDTDDVAPLYDRPDDIHHLAATYSDGKIAIYIDGEQVAAGGESGHGPMELALGDLRFGEDYPPTSLQNEPFLGEIDDVLVLRRVLNTDEMAALAADGPPAVIDPDRDQGVWYAFEEDPKRADIVDALPADGAQNAALPNRLLRGEAELLLNLATSAAGSIQVEIQQPDGTPIEGYTLEDCDEVFGDAVDQPVSWRGQCEVKPLAGKPVRLRFLIKDADLYSYRFGRRSQ